MRTAGAITTILPYGRLHNAVTRTAADTESRAYGNLRWTWRDGQVTDRNAVEFCMQDAVVVWADHWDWAPEAARKELRELMVYGIESTCRIRILPHSMQAT